MRSFLAVCMLSFGSAVGAFVVTPQTTSLRMTTTSTTTTIPTTQLQLIRTVQEAIAEAQRICAEDPASPECRVAWDVVEELEAADSHRQQEVASMPPGQASIDSNAMLGSFDILSQKIEGKMDQLDATCQQLQSMGADPVAMDNLIRLSGEMKEWLAYTKSTFGR